MDQISALHLAILAFPLIEEVPKTGGRLRQHIPFHGCQRLVLTKMFAKASTDGHMVGDELTNGWGVFHRGRYTLA